MENKDELVITKVTFGYADYIKPLKVSVETHAKVKHLAEATRRPISEVANILIEFALSHVKIEEE